VDRNWHQRPVVVWIVVVWIVVERGEDPLAVVAGVVLAGTRDAHLVGRVERDQPVSHCGAQYSAGESEGFRHRGTRAPLAQSGDPLL
jgi:hypothetical protein